jgi:cation transport regulator
MPYTKNSDLPAAARKRLNAHQQTVFREAFNNALKEYKGNESKAYATAWSAAKKA